MENPTDKYATRYGKPCSDCGVALAYENAVRGSNLLCKPCLNARRRKWCADNPGLTLPLLRETNRLPGNDKTRRANQTPGGQNKLGPSPDRWKERSRTYEGIAKAMADQWGE